MIDYRDEFLYVQTPHRCQCGQRMHQAKGTTFFKCIACGAEGYEVPTS